MGRHLWEPITFDFNLFNMPPEDDGPYWEQMEPHEYLPPVDPEPEIQTELQTSCEIWLMNENESQVFSRFPWSSGEHRPSSPVVWKNKEFHCVRLDEDANVWVFRQKWNS